MESVGSSIYWTWPTLRNKVQDNSVSAAMSWLLFLWPVCHCMEVHTKWVDIVLNVSTWAGNCGFPSCMPPPSLYKETAAKRKRVWRKKKLKISWSCHTNRQSRYKPVEELVHFLLVAKSLSQNWEKREMNICFFFFYCIWTEARGMERYLGARENTDALTFKKAASHSRQNHATPLPLCTARNPWCLQPPSSPVHVQLQTNTHTNTYKVHLCTSLSYVFICVYNCVRYNH